MRWLDRHHTCRKCRRRSGQVLPRQLVATGVGAFGRLTLIFANCALVSIGQTTEECWSDVAAFSFNLTPDRIAEAQRHPTAS
jgi:hypothetical protein